MLFPEYPNIPRFIPAVPPYNYGFVHIIPSLSGEAPLCRWRYDELGGWNKKKKEHSKVDGHILLD